MTLINTGLSIHTHATIVMPADIARVMVGIVGLLPDPNLEFGLYLKGRWDPTTATVEVAPGEYVFPGQEVTPASIRFTEEPPGPEWNVVIHRHPHGYRTFSGTDRASINEEFLASILFIPAWDFPEAVINIPIAPGSKFQVKAKVEVNGELVDVPDQLRRTVAEKLFRMSAKVAKRGDGPVPSGRGTIEAIGKAPKPVRGIARPPLRGIAHPLEQQGFSREDIEDIADSVRQAGLGFPEH